MMALTVLQDSRVSVHTHLGAWAGLKQLDDKTGHQCRDSAVALGPRHRQLFNRAIAVFELGDTCLDKGLKLAGIQMTPLALTPAIDVRPLGRIGGVRPHLTLLQNNFDHHPPGCQSKGLPS